MSCDLYNDQLKIINDIGINYVKIGNTFYTDSKNSLKIIEFCKKNNLKILGIETFTLVLSDELMIQPNMKDDIYYFKKKKKRPDNTYNFDVAERFISDKSNKDLLFEVDFEVE